MNNLMDFSSGGSDDFFISSGNATRLKPRDFTAEDRRKLNVQAGLSGFFISLLAGLVPAGILAALIFEDKVFEPVVLYYTIGLIPILGIILGLLIGNGLVNRELKNGFAVVDDDRFVFWTSRGNQEFHMTDLFGAGPEKVPMKGMSTRLCWLSDHKRGFEFRLYDFRLYEIVNGPAHRMAQTDEDGNDLVRHAIEYHYKRRLSAGKPVARLPEYHFESVAKHKKFLVAGDMVVAGSFTCDGETIEYITKDDNFRIPVSAVNSVEIKQARGQYGPTMWKAHVYTDLNIGTDKVEINLLPLTNAQEADLYLRAVPTTFADTLSQKSEEMSGYWN